MDESVPGEDPPPSTEEYGGGDDEYGSGPPPTFNKGFGGGRWGPPAEGGTAEGDYEEGPPPGNEYGGGPATVPHEEYSQNHQRSQEYGDGGESNNSQPLEAETAP